MPIIYLDKPKISEEYEATALSRISSTIDSVFLDEALPYGHESIYRVRIVQRIMFIVFILRCEII